jgi:thiol-disulfide isomerase/thioredoxin/uncharacterized membrane protein YphA (DoxX/SURF4 family)
VTLLDLTLFAARILLAGIFLLAGISKLFDRRGSREALIGFGVPEDFARWLGVVLPIAECIVAVSLLPATTAWWGAVGALSMLTLFVIGITVSLARGRRPNCHCFGQIHSAPVGWATLSRNAILGGMAAFVVSYSSGHANPSLTNMLTAMSASQVITSGAVVLCAALLVASVFLLIQIIRQQGRVLLRLEAMESRLSMPTEEVAEPLSPGLPVGSLAPAFNLNRLEGGESSLDSWLDLKKPVLLFFIHPGCGPCQSLLPDISKWHRESVEKLSILLISEGSPAENASKNFDKVGPPVLLQRQREVAEAYQAYGTPAVVLVQASGTIGSPLEMGADAVRRAALRVIGWDTRAADGQNGRRSKPPVAVESGEIDGSIPLRDTGGREIALSTVLGSRPVVLLFWNPNCGFCQKMLPELRSWDSNLGSADAGLVVISSGTVEQNRAMRLASPVLSDPESTVAGAVNAHGTPMAVLLDAQGRVASDVAAGREAVLALALSRGDYANGEFHLAATQV